MDSAILGGMRMSPARWFACDVYVRVLLLCLVGSLAHAEPQQLSKQLREAVEKRQNREAPRRTLAEQLRRLVDSDASFDPQRRAEALAAPMDRAYYELQPLLDDTLSAQFIGLSSDSLRREWLRRYWVLRDPTPTTPANERLQEHDSRVRFAREHFARAEPPYWDDRARYCLLVGPPEMTHHIPAEVRTNLGYVPEQLFWYYFGERLFVRFVRPEPPDGPWRVGIAGKGFTNRPHVRKDAAHGVRDLIDAFGLPATFYDADRDIIRPQLDPEFAGWVDLSMAPASEALESRQERFTLPGPPRNFLWFVFDTDRFRARAEHREEPVTFRLETHVQFIATDLYFLEVGSARTAHYRLEGVLLDEDLHEIARDAYHLKVKGDSLTGANLWPGQLDFMVSPGTYRLALRLEDVYSGSEGTYVTQVRVPHPGPSRFGLSDIELATTIVPVEDSTSSRFAKEGRLVFPNPVGFYSATRPLTAYIEIYGLTLDERAQGSYRFSYRIDASSEGAQPASRDPAPLLTASFVSTSTVTHPVAELRIDIHNLAEAKYDLFVRVQDLVGGGEASARTGFTVIRF